MRNDIMIVNKYMSEKTPETISQEEMQEKATGRIMNLSAFLEEIEQKYPFDLSEEKGSDLLFMPEEEWVDGEWKPNYRQGKETYLNILKRKINELDDMQPFLNENLKKLAQGLIDTAENIILAYQKKNNK